MEDHAGLELPLLSLPKAENVALAPVWRKADANRVSSSVYYRPAVSLDPIARHSSTSCALTPGRIASRRASSDAFTVDTRVDGAVRRGWRFADDPHPHKTGAVAFG